MICLLRTLTAPQLLALREQPEALEDLLEDEEDFGDPEGARFLELDMGETWHALQYLLTGTAWEGQAPLDFLVRGGEEVGDIPHEEGTARVLPPEQVQELAKALRAVAEDPLRRRFDPARLEELEIYPGGWDQPQSEAPALEEVLSYLAELRTFTAAVAGRGLPLLVHIR
jgi:hypothetical protein